jgi:hypothetical protein
MITPFDRLRFLTLKVFSIALAATLPMASPAHSGTIMLLKNVVQESGPTETAKPDMSRVMVVMLDEKGDLVMQRGALKVTMAYNPAEEVHDFRERLLNAQRTDIPDISGVSVKLSLAF